MKWASLAVVVGAFEKSHSNSFLVNGINYGKKYGLLALCYLGRTITVIDWTIKLN